MANHCDNTLTITGPKADLEAFRKAAQTSEKPLEVGNFIPMPPDLNPEQQRRWAIDTWGTQWGAYEFDDLQTSDNTLTYVFLTAWGPLGNQLLKVMSARFPALNFSLHYEEPSMAFKGQREAHAGDILKEWAREMTAAELNLQG